MKKQRGSTKGFTNGGKERLPAGERSGDFVHTFFFKEIDQGSSNSDWFHDTKHARFVNTIANASHPKNPTQSKLTIFILCLN